MSRNVLVPIDGSDQSYGGVVYALESFPDVELTTLHVIDAEREWYEGLGMQTQWEERGREAAASFHDRAAALAAPYDVTVTTETVVGIPHKQILEYAADHDVEQIVMGSHGRSPITRPFIGHVTEAVARRAGVTVTVVHESSEELAEREIPGRVLVPVDGSEGAASALSYALTRFPEASVTAIHVVDFPLDYAHEELEGTYLERQLADLEDLADGVLARTAEQAVDVDREIETAKTFGKPAQSIVEYGTENGYDQIVLGSHGRSGLTRVLLGSVAEAVARQAPMPVTIVRE